MIRSLICFVSIFLLTQNNSFAACNCGSINSASPCTGQSISVSVSGTVANTYEWGFSSGGGDARCGQFANGDYWVAPASGQSSVTISALSGTGATLQLDKNPNTMKHGFLNYGGTSSGENILSTLPVSESTASSYVAAHAYTGTGCDSSDKPSGCVESYNILTVLTSVPENAGSTILRPNVTGTTKELISTTSLDLTRFPSKAYLTGADAAGLENIRKRWAHSVEIFSIPWSTDSGSSYANNSVGGRAFRSRSLLNDYAADAAQTLHSDLATLASSSVSDTDKRKPLYAVLSYGLDLYHAVFDPPTDLGATYTMEWGSGAGQHLGKFTPVVLLAALETNNATRLANVQGVKNWAIATQPQELAQVNPGVNGPVWGDQDSSRFYWADLWASKCWDGHPGSCNTDAGNQRTTRDPYGYIDGPGNQPGSQYFGIGVAGIYNFTAFQHLMPSFRAAIAETKSIVFIDRVKTHGLQTLPDPVVTPDTRESASCAPYTGPNCLYWSLSGTIAHTWGSTDAYDGSTVAVTTATGAYTQAGRFASLDGTTAPISTPYLSTQFSTNWTTIRAESTYRRHPLLSTGECLHREDGSCWSW